MTRENKNSKIKIEQKFEEQKSEQEIGGNDMNKIKYENKTIAYTVNKARVKNFYITIENGEVVIKAPWYVNSSQIQEVVESKRQWIMQKLEETR